MLLAAASIQEDREPIPRKAVKPVAGVSASADAQGASAPETAAEPAAEQSAPMTKTWGEGFMTDLGRSMDLESSPGPEGSTSHGQASTSDAESSVSANPDDVDKMSVEARRSRGSAAASSSPLSKPKITFQEWKAKRAGRTSVQATGAAKSARKLPASLSPLKETSASRRTRHVPGKHSELFYQSEDSHVESYEGSPSEEGEIAQTHQSEEVSNRLDEQQED
ncbi:hypothetical protein BBJ28_00023632 [Nothophytophthora sp. Chile5]|nr:hypothetical protein BBJ28_00023632 [Nothophytophthora sp. Chile5]